MSQQSERLLKVILDSKLTYAELEKKTGIAKSSIQRYATGNTKKIPVDAVKLIADATNSSAAWIMGWEPEEDSIASDLQAAFTIQGLEKIRMQQAANTYTIHGSNGKGAVIITSDIPKDKYFLIGEGEASELTKGQYSALKSVLDAMSSKWEDK